MQTRRTIFSFIVIISVHILLYTVIRQHHVLKWPAVLSTSEIHILLQGLTLLYTQTHTRSHMDGALYLLENNVCCPFFLYFFFHTPAIVSPLPPTERLCTRLYYYIMCACDLFVFNCCRQLPLCVYLYIFCRW